MERPIDADALQELCNRIIQDTWNSGVAPVSWAEAYQHAARPQGRASGAEIFKILFEEDKK